MKSKLILFLVIQIGCTVDEGKDELNDSKKKSYAYALKKGLDQNKNSIWPKKKESDGDDISSESIFEDAMSESVHYNESVPIESSPNKFEGLRNVNIQNDNSQTSTGSKEIVPDEQAPIASVPDESVSDELDGSQTGIPQDNNSSGGSQLPDSQEVLGLKNFSLETALTEENEQFKTAEDINPERQNVIDNSEDNESKEPFINKVKEDGDIKPETSLIDSNHKLDNANDNSTESDTTLQGESLNDNRELEVQDREEESLNNTKDVSSESSKTPLISAEKNKVNSKNKDISEDLSAKSSNKEDNAFFKVGASGPLGESSFELKNETSSVKINDNQNSINDKDEATVIQPSSDDKITPTPLSDIEGTSIDKDTGNLDELPLKFVPEIIPASNEHKEANDIEKDVSNTSQSPSKIEIGRAKSLIIKDAEDNIKDKGPKTVTENLLNINSAEDGEHLINVDDAGHSPFKTETGKSITLGSSTAATETNINVNVEDHSSPEVGKSTALSGGTTATGAVNNHKEASFEDNSSSEIENALFKTGSTKDEKHSINDKEVSTAGHSSSLGPVMTPISSTVTKDTNNEDDFKERNNFDRVNDHPLGLIERNIANSVKDLNNLSESQSNSLTEGSTSKSVNKDDKNIIQSVNDFNKKINTEFIEAEGINVTGGTPSDEASGNDKTIEDKLNSIKNVTTEFIEEEGSNHNKAINPESDDKIGNIYSSDSGINLKGTENSISKNKDNNTPFLNIHIPDFKIKENNTGRNEGDDDKNPFDTRNENVIVGSVDIMNLSRDKPSTSTSNTVINLDQNINTVINIDQDINHVGTALVEGVGHEDKNNSNSDYDLEDSSYLEDSISTNIEEGSTSSNLGEGSTLGTIGEDSTLGLIGESSILGTFGEGSSLSNNEDYDDLNINNQNGALFGNGLNSVNNRPQTNRTAPILLKFTVSRI